jgi:putative chitinase
MAFELKIEHVRELLKGNKEADEWYPAMVKIFGRFGIDTPERIAGFIAQCGHESNNFTVLEENLNYSSDALDKIFPKYFKKAGRDPKPYHRQPEKIANIIYANRMSNGDEKSGDGWRYRGRGVIQLTGKDNYSRFGKDPNVNRPLEDIAGYLVQKQGALASACWYWNSRNINAAADAGDIVKMTKLVNGGTIGLEDRKKHYEHAMEVLTGKKVHVSAPVATAKATTSSGAAVKTLKLGSTGAAVKKMQKALGLTEDGKFGPGTEAALKQWQETQQLTADGIAGPKTQSLLFTA